MPDFVDKTFDALYDTYKKANGLVVKAIDKASDAVESTSEYIRNNADQFARDLPKEPELPAPDSQLYQYVTKHKYLGMGLATSLSLIFGYKTYKLCFPYKRRAPKLKSGRRFEVILVIGHPESNFVRKLINDLNTRGYIVYVGLTDEKQLRAIEQMRDEDIKPFIVDYESSNTVKGSLMKLAKFLDTPTSDGMYFHLRGVLFVPDYFHMPKIKTLGELNAKEYQRVVEEQFLRMNTLLANGLTVFLKESNNRRKNLEECNGLKITGGYAKLIFVNFVMYARNETRTLLYSLATAQNNAFYNELYNENANSVWQSACRLVGYDTDHSKIDMTQLNITYKKDTESHLIGDSFLFDPEYNRKLSSKDVHYKIFDLLNSRWLKRQYSIHN